MGSEQSSQRGKAVRSGLRRGKSVPDYRAEEEKNSGKEAENSRTISPEPSVCSDSELPYISYTVNRPIGDSPKKKSTRRLSRSKLSSSSSKRSAKVIPVPLSRTGHNIVVVNKASSQPSMHSDPDYQKLQNIPMFLPIMRATLHSPAARDPEVLERLETAPLFKLCHLYQHYLNTCATEVASEQEKLTKQIVVVDKKATQVLTIFNDKQKTYGKHAENFSIINDVVQKVEKCSVLLKDILKMLQEANDLLPDDLKLEPFAWTTG